MDVGKNIKNMRRKRGLTQEELGKLIGVEKSAISRWENGERKPSIDHLKKMSHTLDVPVGFLLSNNISYEREYVDGDFREGFQTDPHESGVEMVREETETFDAEEILLALPKIDDPELIQAFEGFKELDKLTPDDLQDIKAILKLANTIIEKRLRGD
jgi:transcriptional regulator with XRE-family HTH domain